MVQFSDYIAYIDESGDPSLQKIDANYPIFCLVFCLVKKEDYITKIVPAIQRLKFDFWGHDYIVLHEREIRKEEGDFIFLRDKKLRQKFFDRLNTMMKNLSYVIVSSVIIKEVLKEKYRVPYDSYGIALRFCMEKILSILKREGEEGKKITCIFEQRGKKEDHLLCESFNDIVKNTNSWGYRKNDDFSLIDFEIKFASKKHNSTGLQLADLMARPVGLSVLKPNQKNTSYDIIKSKYYDGYTNKVFP